MIDFTLNLIETEDLILAQASALPFGDSPKPLRLNGQNLYTISDRARSLFNAVSATEQHAAELGQNLFREVLRDSMRDLYHSARPNGDLLHPLRFLVQMEEGSPLQKIPWELLHDGVRFLAKDGLGSVVRSFPHLSSLPLLQVERPLRVLVTAAEPLGFKALNTELEFESIREAYRGAGKAVDLLFESNVSKDQLEIFWRRASESPQKAIHVWHHSGHGGAAATDGEGFELYLEKNRRPEPTSVSQIKEIIGHCSALRVAIFNVCEGGAPESLVPGLAGLNVPVVVGFPFPVADRSATRFAAALHQSLLTFPPEIAVSMARRSLKVAQASNLDWAQALVVSRRRDRGPLLEPREQSQTRAEPRPKPAANRDEISIKIGDVNATKGASVIGEEFVGTTSALPGSAKVQIESGNIQAENVRVVGFSARELESHDKLRAGLLSEIDRLWTQHLKPSERAET